VLADAGARAAARERVIDRLHEDNQRLRSGERQLLLRPVLTDLCRLRDGLLRQAATLPASVTAAEMSDLLGSFAYSVEQALERCGVRPLGSSRGDAVDPGRHRVAGTVATAEPDQDGRVAEVLADGYLDTVDDRVLAPAAVRVSQWAPSAGDRQPTAVPGTAPGTHNRPA
jgi:molecular chaperone GrpE